jgi:methanogenic corrinoid protein MtbC1
MERLSRDNAVREGSSQGSSGYDCSREAQRLPFNTDSPTWVQPGPGRPDIEDRMTRLVKTIETQIIPRLLEAHKAEPAAPMPAQDGCAKPSRKQIEAFAKLVLAHDEGPVHVCVGEWRRKGLSVESLYLCLLSPTAQHLGDLWCDDQVDFTEVTVGVGRLQHLLRELSAEFGTEVEFPMHARRALLVPSPGEQHTFGLSMVAEFFRRAGWEVAGGVGGSRTDAVNSVQNEWFDIVGFSVGSDVRLDWLTTGIASIRQLSRNKDIAVMVGGPLISAQPELAGQVGADGTASDGKHAPGTAETLIALRLRCR